MIKLTIKNETDYSTRDLRKLVLAALHAHSITRCTVTVTYKRKGTRRLGWAYLGTRRDTEAVFEHDKIAQRAWRAGEMRLLLDRDPMTRETRPCEWCNGHGTFKLISTGGDLQYSRFHPKWFTPRRRIFGPTPLFEGVRSCVACFGVGDRIVREYPRDPEEHALKVAQTIDHECYHLRGLNHREFPKHVLEGRVVHWFVKGKFVLRYVEPAKPEAAKVDDKREKKLEHAREMFVRAITRSRRAKTIENKWLRRVKAIEQSIAKAARKE